MTYIGFVILALAIGIIFINLDNAMANIEVLEKEIEELKKKK